MDTTALTAHRTLVTRRDRIQVSASYYAGFIALGLAVASVGAALPRLAQNTGSTVAQVALLFTATALGYLTGSSQSGRWYDRAAGHRLLAACLVVIAGMLALFPLVGQLWLLLAVGFIMGCAQGALDVGGNTLIVWVHGKQVGPWMNALHMFFGIGSFVSPLIIGQVLDRTGDITWGFWILTLLILPVALWIYRMPSPQAHQKDQEAANGKGITAQIVLFAVFFFLCVGAETGFGSWLTTFAVQTHLADEVGAAYLAAAFWAAFTFGRLIAIPLAAVLKPQLMLLGDLLICGASVSLLALFPAAPNLVWIGVLGAGVSIASLFATTMTLAEQQMPITGKVTSGFFVGISSGGLIVPWLIGQFFERVGPQALIYAELLVVALALSILAVLVSRYGRPRRLPADSL